MAQYDVFLNHRGELKGGFVSHLNQALKSAGLNPFLDKEALEKGGHAQGDIGEALDGAQVHVAVVSKGYAQSEYCLDELTDIMDSWVSGKTVIPVFYGVHPSDLREVQKGPFAPAFLKHDWKSPERVGLWVEALRDLAGLTGFCLADYTSNEAELVRHVVEDVKKHFPHLNQQIVSAHTEERRSFYQASSSQNNSRIVDHGCRCRPGSNEWSGPQQIIRNQTILNGNVYIGRNHRERDDGDIIEAMRSMSMEEIEELAFSAPGAYPMRAPIGSPMQQLLLEEVEDDDNDESSLSSNHGDDNFSMTFDLLPIDYQIPPGYRLATIQDVRDNREAVCREMPGWEIAKLADGYVDGKLYGCRTGTRRRKGLGHKLVVS